MSTAGSEPEQLADAIKRDREELGQTMAALADKADVKGRLTGSAAKAKETVAERASKAKETVAGTAVNARQAMAGTAGKAAEKTAGMSRDVAAEVAGTAESLAEMAGKGVERVRRNPMPAIAVALAAIFAIFVIRRKRR